MEATSIPESGVIKDSRGEVKVFSKPPKKIIKRREENLDDTNLQSERKFNGFSIRRVFKILRFIGCWIPVILFFSLIIVVIAKPAIIWNEVVNFLNADLLLPEEVKMGSNEAKEEINSQIKNVGNNTIKITEPQLAALISESFSQLKDLKVDIEDGYIKFIWVIESSNPKNPLYGIIQMELDENNNLAVKKIGTQRIQLPEVLNKVISDSIISVTKLQGGNNQDNLIYTILSFDSKVSLNSMKLENDMLILDVTLDANLF